MSKDAVRAYYAAFDFREWERLTWPEGQLEYRITESALKRNLPKLGRVLDLGGGAGRWTAWLSERGYQATLADLSPNLLEVGREKLTSAGLMTNVEDIQVTGACDLKKWPDKHFDAILCLGPFYHLVEEDDRERAAAEIVRVLKTDGVVFCAYMPIYGFLRRTLALKDERKHLADEKFIEHLVKEGRFVNDVEGRFNSGYGVMPEAIAPFWKERGVEMRELLSNTGFAASNANDLAELSKTDSVAYEQVMGIVEQSASDPSCFGSAVHLLFVGNKCK